MTNELEPCPFCGEDVVHEFETNEIGAPYGDGLYVCQNPECGAKFKFPQDWNLSMSRKRESERRFNTRYKRTCKMELNQLAGMYQCSECGEYSVTAAWQKEQGHLHWCANCGAEVVDGD